jgi:hypothetical protein
MVVNLRQHPIDIDAESLSKYKIDDGAYENGDGRKRFVAEEKAALLTQGKDLPEKLSVLFVDDDPILRKLFARMVKNVASNWEIREAANGETAVRLADIDKIHFDIIFVCPNAFGGIFCYCIRISLCFSVYAG